jgi:hypothetical protein
MPSSGGGNAAGRVHSHQRPHDNSVPILGQNLSDIGEEYENALHDTVKRGMDDKCRKDYRRRQLKIVEHWEKSCPQYYEVGREIENGGARAAVDYSIHFLVD